MNLIDNAAKYGGAEPIVEIDVEPREKGAFILVRDRGPGIPREERERVFDRFHRIDRPEHAHAPGTGLGLSLVRELARSHGGDARITDRNGGGTEVQVALPYSQ